MTPQRKTALQLSAVAATMLSLSFAAVPFYDWFCRVTGFGGTTSVASEAPDTMLEQTIKVRFDASKAAGMPWDFVPMQREMTVRYGEVGLAFYRAHNPTDRPVAGTASFNVTPDSAGGYFAKIDCFCFQQQTLQPGESIEMPVTFFVDPELTRDREGRFVNTITLSYTFHETPLHEEQAATGPAKTEAVN